MIIKVYCSEEDKETIQKNAEAVQLNSSKYLRLKGLSNLYERAAFVELISCMVRLLDTDTIQNSVRDDLLRVAQNILEGGSINEARARIVEVCNYADQGN